MKPLFDESLSPKLVFLLRDLFPESESALRNGLARTGDRRILNYAAAHDFILVSTDSKLNGKRAIGAFVLKGVVFGPARRTKGDKPPSGESSDRQTAPFRVHRAEAHNELHRWIPCRVHLRRIGTCHDSRERG